MPITDRAQLSEKPCQLSAYSLRISGRSIEAHHPEFDFARFLDSEALSKAIYRSLGCK